MYKKLLSLSIRYLTKNCNSDQLNDIKHFTTKPLPKEDKYWKNMPKFAKNKLVQIRQDVIKSNLMSVLFTEIALCV
jgi:hypothetical protein